MKIVHPATSLDIPGQTAGERCFLMEALGTAQTAGSSDIGQRGWALNDSGSR